MFEKVSAKLPILKPFSNGISIQNNFRAIRLLEIDISFNKRSTNGALSLSNFGTA